MAQSNNNSFPQFSYNTHLFGQQQVPLASDQPFPQWPPHSARPSNLPTSHSPVYRQTRSPSNTRPLQPGDYSQSLLPQGSNHTPIDPRLASNTGHLAIPPNPQIQRPRSALDSVNANSNPIVRFYQEEAPWSSERMRSSQALVDRGSMSHPNLNISTYREHSASESQSLTHGSDSGYNTHHPQSIISNDQDRYEPELPGEMAMQVRNITMASTSSDHTESFHMHGQMHNIDQISTAASSRSASKEIRCPEPDCKEVSKCRSDYKKHQLKHNKPFRCEIANCRRNGKGFTTVNDLNRHKKSVHRIGALENSYRCASETCRNKEKIWPRLDNFKQHISRMHQDEEEGELIRKSAFNKPPVPSSEPLSVAPMDTTLAGIDTDKQYPSNESDDPPSGMSLTPDQDSIPTWTSNFPSTHEFAMDVDQSGPNMFGRPGLRRPSNALETQSMQRTISSASAHTTSSQSLQHSNTPLDTLALVATENGAPLSRETSNLPLSSAPQTKADQQKQAIHKLTRLIVQDIQRCSDNATDLETVVFRVLSNTGKRSSRGNSRQDDLRSHGLNGARLQDVDVASLTKTEAMRACQGLTHFVKQTKKPIGVNNRPKPFSTSAKTCDHCNVTLARSCDMRKHMKRHTKPYGCTYPKCNKRFGAKSDWKRHENSQHFQLESYRCQVIPPGHEHRCGEFFHRAELFKAHFEAQHSHHTQERLSNLLKLCRIGKNGQGRFWCGFCRDIIELQKKRNEAWDERFDHIDSHFNKDKMSIEEWLCVEAKKTKGEVKKDMDKNHFDDDDSDPTEPSSPDDEVAASNDAHDGEEVVLAPAGATVSTSRKRHSDGTLFAALPPRAKRQQVNRYCCQCLEGPVNPLINPRCMGCDHPPCSHCGFDDVPAMVD